MLSDKEVKSLVNDITKPMMQEIQDLKSEIESLRNTIKKIERRNGTITLSNGITIRKKRYSHAY